MLNHWIIFTIGCDSLNLECSLRILGGKFNRAHIDGFDEGIGSPIRSLSLHCFVDGRSAPE
jgi:hypothetical protein